MNISIIVGGRFHAFDLARELNNNNHLNQLISTYPKFFIKKNYNINKEKVESIYLKEIVQRSFINKIYNFDNKLIDYFDFRASKLIKFDDLDILIGWSSFSLKSFLVAKKYKCIKILERGSTHIEFQDKIVNEEYKIHKIKPKPISKHIIEKEKKEYEIADFITVPTEFAKKTFLEKGFSENKIIKIPYGVSLSEFNSKNKKKKYTKFRIIYTGSVSVRKGIIYLLSAFTQLNLKDSELLIIGNIDDEIQHLIKKFRSNKDIIFKNSVKQSELSEYYLTSNLFVTCSIEEGLSMVQLQAMSCGLPLICTANSGGEEIIKNDVDGYVIPIRDLDALKKKILFLYNNQSICNKMGKLAQLKVQRDFSWESYGKNVIATYKNLLRK